MEQFEIRFSTCSTIGGGVRIPQQCGNNYAVTVGVHKEECKDTWALRKQYGCYVGIWGRCVNT